MPSQLGCSSGERDTNVNLLYNQSPKTLYRCLYDPKWERMYRMLYTTLGDRCDYAQIIKVYTNADPEGERRYSPADVSQTRRVPVMGDPEPDMICTSHIERQNLTIRMQMRRLTRLTNAFSKKWDNLWSAYCLHFAYYNFCRIHKTLRVTPAMEAGITNRVWDLKDLLA